MFVVYLLYSIGSSKTYLGFTNDIERRLTEHNTTGIKGFTKRYRPWVLIHDEKHITKEEAMRREKYLKSGKGRAEVKKLIEIYLNKK